LLSAQHLFSEGLCGVPVLQVLKVVQQTHGVDLGGHACVLQISVEGGFQLLEQNESATSLLFSSAQ
jgi:hypothetical protein